MSNKTTDPIRNPSDIAKIKSLLKHNPREYGLFVLGINLALRASDLLSLDVEDVCHLKVGDPLVLKEKKTSKKQVCVINEEVYDAIQNLISNRTNGPLFVNQKRGTRLTTHTLNVWVQEWCEAVEIRGSFGSHSLRKTFGYQHRTNLNTPIEIIQTVLNHSSPSVTRRYLGIQSEEVTKALLKKV